MKNKILVLISLLCFMFIFTGCSRQLEVYNNKDKNDFKNGAIIKFKVIQFKNIMDEKMLKESKLNGSFFICVGHVSAESKEQSVLTNMYYMYVKNKNGAIYFAYIPSNKIRIYEDSEVPYLVGNMIYEDDDNITKIDPSYESKWDQYDMFNLHIPKGTVIPKIDYNFNVDSIKK